MQDLLSIHAPVFMDMLSEPVADKITRAGQLVAYSDGQLIHSRGDDKPGMSIVKSGTAHIGIYGADGSFVMTSIFGAGQTFGEFTLFAGLPRTHDVTASGATHIYQISEARFIALHTQEPEIAKALLTTTLMRTHLLLEMMDAMRRLPIRERTAKILLAMMKMSHTNDVFVCRQSDLAFTLGVSRMSLSTALKQLAALGLIETGYGEIRLPDPARIANWVADNCSGGRPA